MNAVVSPEPNRVITAYDVTSVDAASNESLFVELRRAALGEEASNAALHHWQYCEGPHGPSEALLLRSLQGDEPEPVGWVSVQPHRLAIDGAIRQAGLLVNLAVTPEHRKVFPALMLQRTAAERARSGYELSFGYPNHAALGGFLRARYQKLGAIVRYACPLGDFDHRLERAGLRHELAVMAGQAV